jgi:hypothetical protein
MAVGKEAKEMSLECQLGSDERVGWAGRGRGWDGWVDTPSEPESLGGDNEEEDEDKEEGEVTPHPTLNN